MVYYRPAPGRTDGIPERHQRPCDNGYKFVFTNSWLVRQRHRSWIKGLGKNPQKSTKRMNSFIACSAFCLGPPNRDPRDSEKWWRVYTSIAMMACHTWHVYKSSGKTHKNRNACIDTHRWPSQQKFAGLYGIRCELVKANFTQQGHMIQQMSILRVFAGSWEEITTIYNCACLSETSKKQYLSMNINKLIKITLKGEFSTG